MTGECFRCGRETAVEEHWGVMLCMVCHHKFAVEEGWSESDVDRSLLSFGQ